MKGIPFVGFIGLMLVALEFSCGSGKDEVEPQSFYSRDSNSESHYFRDFDEFRMEGIDELTTSSIDYPFVEVKYDSGRIVKYIAHHSKNESKIIQVIPDNDSKLLRFETILSSTEKLVMIHKDNLMYSYEYFRPDSDYFLNRIIIEAPAKNDIYKFMGVEIPESRHGSIEDFQKVVKLEDRNLLSMTEENFLVKGNFLTLKEKTRFRRSGKWEEELKNYKFESKNASVFWYKYYGGYFKHYPSE